MSARIAPRVLFPLPCRRLAKDLTGPQCQLRRVGGRLYSQAAAVAEEQYDDLEQDSSLQAEEAPEDVRHRFDPIKRSEGREKQLPPSRYQFRSPRFYRGPLHPIQPLKPTEPSSREFVPGPFSTTRVEQTYDAIIQPDLMTLTYHHVPGGHPPPLRQNRLREWDESSPYHKNRELRQPRGGDVLRLQTKPTTFQNVPKLQKIVVHTMPKGANADSAYLHVGSIALQAITGVRSTPVKARHTVASWKLKEGDNVALKVELTKEDMYHFLAKCLDSVLPRIKDWKGVAGTSGDESGNITFGLTPEGVALFPEVEVNYDSYPPSMIPGCHITLVTTATNDRDGRMLCSALGLPFYGKFVN